MSFDERKPRRKRKPIEDIEAPPTAELLLMISKIPDPKYRSFMAALWLWGNRVSELLGIRTREIVGYNEYTKAGRKKKIIKFKVPIYKTYRRKELEKIGVGEWEVAPPKAINYEFDEINGFVRVHKVRTLKRQGRPPHTYTAKLNRPEEKLAWELIYDYWLVADKEKPLWSFSRKTAWYYCNKYLGIPPHKLRGERATRDSEVIHLDATVLKKKFNWASAHMALYYAEKNIQDVERNL